MFKVSILSVSIWILAGLLTLTAIGVLIWRLSTFQKEKQKSNNVGSVSKAFNDFIVSEASTNNLEIIYNILFKNKFAKKKYSIIPAIIFYQNKPLLLTNMVAGTKIQKVIFPFESKIPIVQTSKKELLYNQINFTWTIEIIKYLNHLFPDVIFKTFTPILQETIQVENHWNNHYWSHIIDFEKQIEKIIKDIPEISDFQKQKIVKKITSLNLFKKTISAKDKKISFQGNK